MFVPIDFLCFAAGFPGPLLLFGNKYFYK